MTMYALTSVSGSPGVTTTALAWAYASSRPTLLVEADPTGGSAMLAGLWDGAQPHDRSVLDLANFPPEELADRLWESTLMLPGTTRRWVLPAVGTGAQSAAMMPVWTPIAAALRELSATELDVVVDVGRVTLTNSPWALVDAADAVLVLTRGNLQSLNALSIALPDLRAGLSTTGTAQRLGVVPVVGGPRRFRFSPWGMHDFGAFPYGSPEVGDLSAPTRVVAPLVFDERAAAIYSNALPSRSQERVGGYWRSITHLISAADEHATKARSITDLEGQ